MPFSIFTHRLYNGAEEVQATSRGVFQLSSPAFIKPYCTYIGSNAGMVSPPALIAHIRHYPQFVQKVLPRSSISSSCFPLFFLTLPFFSFHTKMPFNKLFDAFKTQNSMPQRPVAQDDTALLQAPQITESPKRRWSYVTYLEPGTLQSKDDNLMVGL